MRFTVALVVGTLVSAPLSAQAPTDADGTPFFLRKAQPPADALKAYQQQPYRPVRPAEVHSAGFLTEGQLFAFGGAVGATEPSRGVGQGSPAISALGSAFSVDAPDGESYSPGDTLLVATVDAGPKGWGERVIPTGLVVVTSSNGRRADTEVLAIYGAMRGGQVVYRAEAFVNPGEVKPVASESGPTGAVIAARETRELLVPTSHIYTDLGQRDGIKIGDFVEVRRGAMTIDSAAAPLEPMATGQVVHVSANSSTVKLMNVLAPQILPGAPVVRVATLP
jgi:hypothetical protein